MTDRSALRYWVAPALLLATTGCSFLFVDGPPVGHQQRDFFTCTESKTFPTVDAILAGLNTLGVLVAEDDASFTKEEYQASGTLWAVVNGLSANSGFNKVSACEVAQVQAAQRRAAAAFADLDSPSVTPDSEPWRVPMVLPRTLLKQGRR